MALYEELKSWQSAIAAIVGFTGLIVGALWNFHLNRRRDAEIRQSEMLSVASALYGEILLLRQEAARVARIIAQWEANLRDCFEHSSVEDYLPGDPILYPALASKIGLLPPDLVLAITEFHKNYRDVKDNMPLVAERPGRVTFCSTAVLEPAWAAVMEVRPALRKIEALVGIPEASDPDLGYTDAIIENRRATIL